MNKLTLMASLGIALIIGVAQAAAPKMIIDADYNTISDDGQVGVMAAQLMAEGKLDVLGITVVAGNQWRNQEVADALKSVERLGVGDKIGVYAGATRPLMHDYKSLDAEKALFGVADGYFGAWSKPEPAEKDLTPPPDGFATKTKVQAQNAVDFIVDTVKKNPNEVTILAIGPLTNIALAIRKNPEIVPLIKRIVYMGGAVEVPGNTSRAAEFNIWFDPEAARIVLREPIEHILIPLDVTDTVFINKSLFDRITNPPSGKTVITKLFEDSWIGKNIQKDPTYKNYIWDTLALAYAMDPTFSTDTAEVFIDVDTTFGPNYGRTVGYYTKQPTPLLQKVKFVRKFDNERFYNYFVDLMTRPVPVKLK